MICSEACGFNTKIIFYLVAYLILRAFLFLVLTRLIKISYHELYGLSAILLFSLLVANVLCLPFFLQLGFFEGTSTYAIYGAGAFFAGWILSAIVSALDSIPLVSS